jgi:hypothetical protein
MPETPYMNRELDEQFNDIKNTLGRIEAQTTKTNGRVSKLEHWQAYVVGFCGAVTLLVLPVLFKLFLK